MELRILAVGDVVGATGILCLKKNLRALRRRYNIDFAVVNGENASGVGLTEEQAWVVRYYPASGPVGLIEFLMDPDAEDLEEAAFAELPASEAEGDSGETPQELSEKNE